MKGVRFLLCEYCTSWGFWLYLEGRVIVVNAMYLSRLGFRGFSSRASKFPGHLSLRYYRFTLRSIMLVFRNFLPLTMNILRID